MISKKRLGQERRRGQGGRIGYSVKNHFSDMPIPDILILRKITSVRSNNRKRALYFNSKCFDHLDVLKNKKIKIYIHYLKTKHSPSLTYIHNFLLSLRDHFPQNERVMLTFHVDFSQRDGGNWRSNIDYFYIL